MESDKVKKHLWWLKPLAWSMVPVTIVIMMTLLGDRSTGESPFLEGVFVGKAMWICFIPFIIVGTYAYYFDKRKPKKRVLPFKYVLVSMAPFLIVMFVEGGAHFINEYADRSEPYLRECEIQGYKEMRRQSELHFLNCSLVKITKSTMNKIVEQKAKKVVLSLKKGALGKEWLQDISLN
jgi:hypothetical protein